MTEDQTHEIGAQPFREGRRLVKRLRWLLLVLLVLSLPAGAAGYVRWSHWTPSKVDRAIRRSLPVGTSRDEVEAWLDAETIWHCRLTTTSGRPLNEVFAVIDPAIVRWLELGEIQITFHFNEGNRLDQYEVEWYTFEL